MAWSSRVGNTPPTWTSFVSNSPSYSRLATEQLDVEAWYLGLLNQCACFPKMVDTPRTKTFNLLRTPCLHCFLHLENSPITNNNNHSTVVQLPTVRPQHRPLVLSVLADANIIAPLAHTNPVAGSAPTSKKR